MIAWLISRRWWLRYVFDAVFLVLLVFVFHEGMHHYDERLRIEHEEQAWATWNDLISYTNTAIIVVDADTRKIVEWNNGAVALLGWQAGEAKGQDIGLVLPGVEKVLARELLRDADFRQAMLKKPIETVATLHTKSGDHRFIVSTYGVQTKEHYLFVGTARAPELIPTITIPPAPPIIVAPAKPTLKH